MDHCRSYDAPKFELFNKFCLLDSLLFCVWSFCARLRLVCLFVRSIALAAVESKGIWHLQWQWQNRSLVTVCDNGRGYEDVVRKNQYAHTTHVAGIKAKWKCELSQFDIRILIERMRRWMLFYSPWLLASMGPLTASFRYRPANGQRHLARAAEKQ